MSLGAPIGFHGTKECVLLVCLHAFSIAVVHLLYSSSLWLPAKALEISLGGLKSGSIITKDLYRSAFDELIPLAALACYGRLLPCPATERLYQDMQKIPSL